LRDLPKDLLPPTAYSLVMLSASSSREGLSFFLSLLAKA